MSYGQNLEKKQVSKFRSFGFQSFKVSQFRSRFSIPPVFKDLESSFGAFDTLYRVLGADLLSESDAPIGLWVRGA